MWRRWVDWLRGSAEVSRFVRFLVVGGGLFLLDLVLFLALASGLSMAVPVAATISVTVRVLVGFLAHKKVTFQQGLGDGALRTGRQGVAYGVMAVVNIPITAFVVTACVWALGDWNLGGKVLAEAIMVFEVYLAYKFIVYR
jgi:putative flippase GtrA